MPVKPAQFMVPSSYFNPHTLVDRGDECSLPGDDLWQARHRCKHTARREKVLQG
jgi:hypothetical protein